MDTLGFLLKCRFWASRSGLRFYILTSSQAMQVLMGSGKMVSGLSSKQNKTKQSNKPNHSVVKIKTQRGRKLLMAPQRDCN